MTSNSVLLERMKAGDSTAEAALVENNMGLVMNTAKRFSNRGYDFEELVQVGSIGLIKAVQRFDPEFDVQFSTYAVPMIMGEIRRFLRDDGLLKVSRSIKENAMKGRRAEEELRRELMREPTLGEISKRTGLSAEALIEAFDASAVAESIYLEAEAKEGEERLRAPDCEADIINRVLIHGLLERLEARERQIIVLRFFKDKTQSEISKIIGVSQVQVSRIEKAVLKKLREMVG